MFKTTGIIISTVVLLQGCSGLSVKQQKLPSVTSSPSGAVVYANILELGKTPLTHNLYDAFPAGWQNSTYQAQGILIVKMDGCKDYTLKVSDFILSKPIHADLECSKTTQSKKLTPVKNSPGSAEKRFEELEALYKKGVITKDEYKKTRERILNEL